jgi:hypothetical protein
VWERFIGGKSAISIMGRHSGRFRHDRRAMSPQRALLYFAVIPLLCTLMLAVPLGYYTSTSMSGGKVTLPSYSLQLERTTQGNWTLTFLGGGVDAGNVTFKVIDPATGGPQLSSKLNASSDNFTWNDNNRNGRFDAGDSILINQTGIQGGSTVMVLRNTETVFCAELPES